MLLTRENDEKYIMKRLAQIQAVVGLENSQQLYDIDHVLEDFCVGLLNIVFDWSLHNINHEQKNTPAIDLGDVLNKVAVQVTSDNSGSKIKKTVKKFISNGLHNTYNKLLVVVLVPKQRRYTITPETPDTFSFSVENDILDFRDLIRIIKMEGPKKLRAVASFIEREFPDGCRTINFELFDRTKEIINKIESGHEREVLLEIECFFDDEVTSRCLSELIDLDDLQADRKEFLDFYEDQLEDILAEEGNLDEYKLICAQSEQCGYYEPLYDFCAGYRFRTQIPYDLSRREIIDFRAEHTAFLMRKEKIKETRKKCVEAIKAHLKEMR